MLADDHPIVRQGLRLTVEADPLIKVVAEASDGEEALRQIEQLKPQVAVLDIDMPKLDGFGVARELQRRRLSVEIIFLTLHSEEDLFHTAMDLGAKGYVLKESAISEITNGIKVVASGQLFVTPSLTAYLLNRVRRLQSLTDQQPSLNTLTPTERRILSLIADSKSSKEIAAELFIHYRTVENHRTSICQKLGIHGPHALLKFALRHKSEL
ncbi:MAG: response regulator transcription factor [Blastocatellia bacterium]